MALPLFLPALKDRALIGLATGKSLRSLGAQNPNATDAWVMAFDAALTSDVTLGTTTPKHGMWVPAGGWNSEDWSQDAAPTFSLGIVLAAVTTPGGAVLVTTGLPLNATVY